MAKSFLFWACLFFVFAFLYGNVIENKVYIFIFIYRSSRVLKTGSVFVDILSFKSIHCCRLSVCRYIHIMTESIRKFSNFNSQSTLCQNNLKDIAFFFTFFEFARNKQAKI